MSTVFRLARSRAAGAAAAAATATVAQPATSARAPTAALQTSQHRNDQRTVKLEDDDGWLGVELDGERFVLKPYDAKEIDDCISNVQALVSRPKPQLVVEELSFEPSSDTRGSSSTTSTTDGHQADEIIECTQFRGLERETDPRMNDLLRITSIMLKRPGMQREVVQAMLEDTEVRDLMLGQARSLDTYLTAAGICSTNLLPAPEDITEGMEQDEGDDVLSRIVSAVAACLDRAGSALAFLGGWLKDRFAFLNPHREGKVQAEGEGEGAAAGGSRAGGRGGGDMLLGGVMVAAVAVFCMLLVRRPLVLRRA